VRGNDDAEYDLPPTFIDLALPYSLHYIITTEIKRGFMRLDDRLEVKVCHIPITKPDRSTSVLRQIAFREASPLPTPDEDPDGYTVNHVIINGKLLSGETVQVECQLHLASPTQYPIGTPIQFFLKLISHGQVDSFSQTQALDILSTPRSIQVSLRRIATTDGVFADKWSEVVSKATTWKVQQIEAPPDGNNHYRLVQGEISLRPELLPDFSFTCFDIGYLVELKLDAAGFTATSTIPPTSNPLAQLLSIPVQLTNTSRPGDPLPKSYAPAPHYTDSGSGKIAEWRDRSHRSGFDGAFA